MLLGYRTHDDCVAGSFDPPTMISERGPIYGVDLLVGVRSQCVHAPTQLVVPKTILKSSEPPSDLTTPTHNDSRTDVEVWERAANDPMKKTYDESSWLAAQERDKTDEDKLVQRKLRSTLNKLTDTNFDRLKDRLVTQCGMKSVVHVQCLIELLFEKAVAQQQSAFLYSRLVKEMGDELSKILQSSDELKENTRKPERLFRWLVIDRLERNFKASIETKFEPAADLTEDEEFEEFLKYQEKQTGLLRFVGLLLAHNLLPARCAIGIMEELVEGKDAQRLEALCPFMENAGAKIIHSNSKEQYCDFVDTKVGQLTDDPEVPVRIRILLQESVKTHKKLVE
ncbi:MAG: hypothetical protein KVP17_002405 [Porospora cf. gigantea B]|uniref:uncharacterized protein n=1 Tax=Porospora cf. gigantea B TaxID=2853592 RepID=UPI003571B1A3|nr:MAG: hypothetical protein KVP17_002405 [Porospora cf. gigantea B]